MTPQPDTRREYGYWETRIMGDGKPSVVFVDATDEIEALERRAAQAEAALADLRIAAEKVSNQNSLTASPALQRALSELDFKLDRLSAGDNQ